MTGKNKVLWLDPEKYTKLCYLMVLLASGAGVLSNLLRLVGIGFSGGGLIALIGLAGIVLSATGWIAFKERFSPVSISHFKFVLLLFVAFFLIGLILGGLIMGLGLAGGIILFLLSAFQFVLLLTGYRLWQYQQEATKESLINGLKNLKSLLKK